MKNKKKAPQVRRHRPPGPRPVGGGAGFFIALPSLRVFNNVYVSCLPAVCEQIRQRWNTSANFGTNPSTLERQSLLTPNPSQIDRRDTPRLRVRPGGDQAGRPSRAQIVRLSALPPPVVEPSRTGVPRS